MKTLLLLLMILTMPQIHYAQCNGIKAKRDQKNGKLIWSSSLKLPVGVRRVMTNSTDSLFVLCNINNDFPTAHTQGLTIYFSDSTTYRNTEQRTKIIYYIDKFYHAAFVPVSTDSLKSLFLKKDIISFTIGNYPRNVSRFEAAALRRYLECLMRN